MPRSAFLFTSDARGLVERRFDPESFETLGHVESAPYLAGPTWMSRIFSRFRPTDVRPKTLRAPFDHTGRDILTLLPPTVPLLDGHDDPIGATRLASGRVTCLPPREPGDTVVLRDLWATTVRLLDGAHFAIETHDGEPIVIAFARAPLIVAAPTTRTLDEHLDAVSPFVSSACRDALVRASDGLRTAQVVEIHEGDTVDVLGLTWMPDDAERRFDLRARTAGYRSAPRPLRLVIADAPGTRIVIRRTGARLR
ncbi:hypothetical protein [Sandaracinus amylolyticus]|uniref:Uncharacterized protein n=1 Tax=Sandaracinus amylolyticus TaxID=927083 RepID=A0A0F6W8K9_9BACT|nr:hypothetical protein [Sandaracinus amylolyticus]AKF10167.1 hypothetical protein DB32_007316 [Sandaracinus amylolyticus]